MIVDQDAWFDDAAGPLVRPYAVTGGRTRVDMIGLDLITLVVAVREPAGDLESESLRILRVCQQPMSVVEVAAHVNLPLQVVKVLLSDLITQNLMIYRSAGPSAEAPSPQILQAVLDGIRKL